MRNSFLPQLPNTERERFLSFDNGVLVLEANGFNSLFRFVSGSLPADYTTEWLYFARTQGGIVVITPSGPHLLCVLAAAPTFCRNGTRTTFCRS